MDQGNNFTKIHSERFFYKKVSCEATGTVSGNYYDYLSFSVDGVEIDKWAGEIDWSLEVFPVSAGIHNFEWLFIKDHAVTSGEDATWIDFVVFPPLSTNECPSSDINQDCIINVLDVVQIVNSILNSESYNHIADINNDASVDVLDVIEIINMIINGD